MRRFSVLVVGLLLAASCAPPRNTSDAPSGETVTVVFGLRRDQRGLSKAAYEVNTPASPTYGKFLDPDELASKFGANHADRKKVVGVLREAGARNVSAPTGGFVQAEMTTAQVSEFLGVGYRTVVDPLGRAYLQASEPKLPRQLEGIVTEIVGLERTTSRPGAGSRAESPTPGADADPDAAAAECGPNEIQGTLDELQAAVGISDFALQGATGQGMRVAIIAIDVFDATSYQLWTECIGLENPTKPNVVDPIKGNSDNASSADEVDLDVSMVIAALPDLSHLDVFVFDAYGWIGTPIARALDPSATGGLPDVISTSIEFCEEQLSDEEINLAEWVLASAAALGVTVVSSAGDTGSSGCYPPDRKQAVQYPASSEFVLAVGGTQGSDEGVYSDPAVWYEPSEDFAGGGGMSRRIVRPAYQESITGEPWRLIPDIAAPAAVGEAPTIPVCAGSSCVWKQAGGTSMAAPLVASALVQGKQLAESNGTVPLGWANPGLYQLDDATRGTFIVDIVHGTNDLFKVGCCHATPGFDMVSGWGALDVAGLASTQNSPT